MTYLDENETILCATISHRISTGRKQAGITQEALGDFLGVSGSTVKNWERGTSLPSSKTLFALAQALGISGTIFSPIGDETLTRSPEEIVQQTNQLARLLLSGFGFDSPEDYQFHESDNPRAKMTWQMACMAQSWLTGTDVYDVLEQCQKNEF